MLDRVRAAVVVAGELGALGDRLVTHYVQAARESGCSWAQIGAQLGVSKQAAQQAFVATARRRGRFARRPPARPSGGWSEQARDVLVAAREEAGALGHNHVGTEHLLLALCAGEGLSAVALRRLGVDQEAVRGHVEDIIGRGDGGRALHRPFTPRTTKVMELALGEAARLGHGQVRTEHLLLALVREGEGLAPRILVKRQGVDLPLVTRTVLELVNSDGGRHIPGGLPTG